MSLARSLILSAILSSNAYAGNEYQFKISSNGVTPTYEDSCFDKLKKAPWLKNGIYQLKQGNYFCDMASGGWTLVDSFDQSSAAAGDFVKGYNYLGEGVSFWTMFPYDAGNNLQKRSVITNLEGIPWTDAKILIEPIYSNSVDSFNNVHGGAYSETSRNSITGLFVDGLYIRTSDEEMISVLTHYDGPKRTSLGIPDDKLKLGTGLFQINHSKSVESPNYIELRAMLDESYMNEDVGFNSYKVWIK